MQSAVDLVLVQMMESIAADEARGGGGRIRVGRCAGDGRQAVPIVRGGVVEEADAVAAEEGGESSGRCAGARTV